MPAETSQIWCYPETPPRSPPLRKTSEEVPEPPETSHRLENPHPLLPLESMLVVLVCELLLSGEMPSYRSQKLHLTSPHTFQLDSSWMWKFSITVPLNGVFVFVVLEFQTLNNLRPYCITTECAFRVCAHSVYTLHCVCVIVFKSNSLRFSLKYIDI